MVEFNLVKVSGGGGDEGKVPGLKKLRNYLVRIVGPTVEARLNLWRTLDENKARISTAETDANIQQIQATQESRPSQLTSKAQTEAISGELGPDGHVSIGPDDVRNAMEFQGKKRLMNVRAIADYAAEDLEGTDVPDHDPDLDWVNRFSSGAQDVSSEELQRLWGKILAGEVKSPGQTSLRTLSILRNMTQQDAIDFSNLMRFRIEAFIFKEGVEKILGDRFGPLMVHFSDIGLFSGLGTCKMVKISDDGIWAAHDGIYALIIEGTPGQLIKIETVVNAFVITATGLELAKLCQYEPDFLYLSYFAKFLIKQNCKLKIGTIIEMNDKNLQLVGIRIIEPFVEPKDHDQKEPSNAE